jgi:peptidoglycan recognition protein
VTRAEWGARAPTNANYHAVPVPYVVIHHGAGGACSTPDDCAAVVRSVQNYHMDTNGWSDIGYSFLVGGDGNVYEGRGWDTVGAHAPGYNSNSQGINFLGDFVSKFDALFITNTFVQLPLGWF